MTSSPSSWVPTRALGRAVLFCAVVVNAGIFLGRVDLVVIAAPFAIGTTWALRRRPTRPPDVAFEVAREEVAEGEELGIALELSHEDSAPADLVVGRLTASAWWEIPGGARPYADRAVPGRVSRVDLRATALHWGHQEVGPAAAYGVAAGGLLVSERVATAVLRPRVLPAVPPFRAEESMPRSSVLAGVHRSRRHGEGGELAGVRRYGPGDRLRRVDWRVTLRTGELHVAQMLTDRDAQVVVLLDVLHEAGRSGGVRGTPSVVDTAVRAAAAITEHYLRQGDRVGLVEYSGSPRYLRVAAGRRHLRAALDWLLETRAGHGSGRAPVFGIEPGLIPHGALVVVLTPLLGPESTEMIATLARAGRSVVAVDTLGDLAHRPLPGSRWHGAAQRLWRLERDNLVGLLREAGVPVTAWAGTGSLDVVLHDMARMAAAPRLGVR